MTDATRTDELPDFDRRAFEALVEDLSRTCADRFEADFLAILPARIRRIEAAVTTGQNPEETIRALLSLKSGATIAGAATLSFIADAALTGISKAFRPGTLLPIRLRYEAQQFTAAYESFRDGLPQAA